MKVRDVYVEGKWWRFDTYELHEGYIRPAIGARLEAYSLFDGLHEKRVQGIAPNPHLELANINSESDQAILDWVHRYGLLGILPHRLEYAEFDSGVRFVRNPTGWSVKWSTSAEQIEEMFANETFGSEEPPAAKAPGRAVLNSWDGRDKEIRSVDSTFDRYFVEGSVKDGYPCPLTELFWESYQESLAEIRQVITMLRRTLYGYERLAKGGEGEQDQRFIQQARDWLRANGTLTPNIATLDGGRRRIGTLVSTSLVNTFATLLWLETAGGQDTKICPVCGKFFFSGRDDSEYCPLPAPCRKTGETQRRRERIAKARDLHAQGVAISDIASQLERDQDTVIGWIFADEANALHRTGSPLADIAQRLNLDSATVRWLIERRRKNG